MVEIVPERQASSCWRTPSSVMLTPGAGLIRDAGFHPV